VPHAPVFSATIKLEGPASGLRSGKRQLVACSQSCNSFALKTSDLAVSSELALDAIHDEE
jgi:hypothetical protein